MQPASSRLAAVLIAVVLVGCGGRQGKRIERPTGVAVANLPAHQDPPLALDDDQDLERARDEVMALPVGAPGRTELRRKVWAGYDARIARSLRIGSRNEGYQLFRQAVSMWLPEELVQTPVPDLEITIELTRRLLVDFSRSGNAEEVVTLLAVLIAADPPRSAQYRETFKEVGGYLDELSVSEAGEGAQDALTIQYLETASEVFPSTWTIDTLVQLYLTRYKALQSALRGQGAQAEAIGPHRALLYPVRLLIAAYALGGRLPETSAKIKELAGGFGDEPELRQALETALAEGSKEEDWLRLASPYYPQSGGEPEAQRRLAVVQRICEEGARRLPQSFRLQACAGEGAVKRGHLHLALRYIEKAHELAPDDHDIATYLLRLYHARMADHATAERAHAAEKELAQLEKFYEDAKKRWPDKPLDPPLVDAYVMMGRAFLVIGAIDPAVKMFERVELIGPHPDAEEMLATIALKRGDYERAVDLFLEAATRGRNDPLEQRTEAARLSRLAGEAHALDGHLDQAKQLWQKALGEWNELSQVAMSESTRATMHVEMGRLHHYLGDTQQALLAFARAVDAAPENPSVYSDSISFLVTRGHYEEALDAYHRALGRPQVGEYFKVYTSLWVVDFARLEGLEPDPLALQFLASRDSTRWYDDLARFHTGKLSFDDLMKRADTRGKRAEAYFYEAMSRYAKGNKKGAEEFLRYVLGTDMILFFEFDMAQHILTYGPPAP